MVTYVNRTEGGCEDMGVLPSQAELFRRASIQVEAISTYRQSTASTERKEKETA
jgi:hypothetical protein